MRRLAVTVVGLGLLLSGCALPGESRSFQSVGGGASSLRDAFNEATGAVRLVLLVSPTCGVCLSGAQKVQAEVLDVVPEEDLRVYVVWLPKQGGESEHVTEATKTLPDSRATHYWDGDGLLMDQYSDLLDLGVDAWDMYLLYPAESRWPEGEPPAPSYWSHQLGSREHPAVTGPWLDGAELLTRTRAALDAAAEVSDADREAS